jgi:predicted hydrocarbon binding protein
MEMADGSRILEVVKHPKLELTRIEVPIEPKQPQLKPPIEYDLDVLAQMFQSGMKGRAARKEVGDFVNLFWPNLAHWSCMLWDPKGFPRMLYEMNKYESATAKEAIPAFPGGMRLAFRAILSLQSRGLFWPRSLGRVQDMKRVLWAPTFKSVEKERSGIVEYLEDASKTDEHIFRIYESSDCAGFENIGVPMASHIPPMYAGFCEMLEVDGREWNAIETKCLGLGDPYCEFKLVAGEIDGLNASLQKDSSVVERIHERLMERLMGFLLEGKPMVERPRLGSDVWLHVLIHGMGFLNLAGERYRRAQMMGAARSAKMIGERLMEAGLSEDEAIERVLDLMNTCKVGKVTLGETVRMRENCESLRATILVHRREPSCFFTTGFLNGLFASVMGQHVREIKCIAMGDSYCEWELL